MRAVILAGGRGSRLQALTGDLPKVLVPIAGRPLLEYLFDVLRYHGITDIVLCTGHAAEKIEAWAGDGTRFGVRIRSSREAVPLGTAGAVRNVRYPLEETFLVLYGDVLCWLDLSSLVCFHRDKKAAATLVVHPTSHPEDSDLVEIDAEGRITSFSRPGSERRPRTDLSSAALYVLEPRSLFYIPPGVPKDFVKDVFPEMLRAGERLYGYRTAEYLKDIGTPQRYEEALEDVRQGRYPGRGPAHQRSPEGAQTS
jgi:mannose-1-phosphate guanylyltransferase/phosphomannomutase